MQSDGTKEETNYNFGRHKRLPSRNAPYKALQVLVPCSERDAMMGYTCTATELIMMATASTR